MYIETSSPRKPGEKAKLALTPPHSGKQSCLSFYYHMYGASAGTLNVYNGNKTIFNVSGNQGNNWVMVESNVYLDKEVSEYSNLLFTIIKKILASSLAQSYTDDSITMKMT